MTETLLVDYLPDSHESYRMARSLAYRITWKSGVLIDAITMMVFGVIGFATTLILQGYSLERLTFRNLDPMLLLLIPIFLTGLLLWRLFRIWCFAPSMNEPQPEPFRLLKSDDSFVIESGSSRVVTPLELLHLHLEQSEFFVIQFSRNSTGIIIPKRGFSGNGVEMFRQILAENGYRANWWNSRKLLG